MLPAWVPFDVVLKYRIRPLVEARPGLRPVSSVLPKTYEGKVRPLCYLDEGVVTNEVHLTHQYAAFNNGILATQWLTHAFERRMGQKLTAARLKPLLRTKNDSFRTYLSGEILPLVGKLFEIAQANPGWKLFLALYELEDKGIDRTHQESGRTGPPDPVQHLQGARR